MNIFQYSTIIYICTPRIKSVTNQSSLCSELLRVLYVTSMEFYLSMTNYVGSTSTIVNGLFVIMILISPPENLRIFRSQYYVGAFTSLFFAATQLWSANVASDSMVFCLISWFLQVFYPNGTMYLFFSARQAGTVGFLASLNAVNLQFMMLSSNFATRYAAVRGFYLFSIIFLLNSLLRGILLHYMKKQLIFYGFVIFFVSSTCMASIVLLYPTIELRPVCINSELSEYDVERSLFLFRTATQATFRELIGFDFMNEFFMVSSYEVSETNPNKAKIFYSIQFGTTSFSLNSLS